MMPIVPLNGPAAIIHAATLKDSIVVGPSAQGLDGCVVESNAIIAVGSGLTPGTSVKGGYLWSGPPATMVQELTDDEISNITVSAGDTAALAVVHALECEKDFEQHSSW